MSGDKPGMFDLVAKKKYEAWSGLKGMSSDEAMQAYVAEVEAFVKRRIIKPHRQTKGRLKLLCSDGLWFYIVKYKEKRLQKP